MKDWKHYAMVAAMYHQARDCYNRKLKYDGIRIWRAVYQQYKIMRQIEDQSVCHWIKASLRKTLQRWRYRPIRKKLHILCEWHIRRAYQHRRFKQWLMAFNSRSLVRCFFRLFIF